MAKTYPVIERAGSRVTVLARTAEEAHRAVTEQLGSGCTIVSVERVRSGGLGGFFATELVRLVAAPRGTDVTAPVESSSFASAEDLVFALPGGGGEFAARLQEELAALTNKGVNAAEATMGRPARPMPDRPAPDVSPVTIEPAQPATSWAPITEPLQQIVAERQMIDIDPDPPLPSADELHWATSEEPARRWRRTGKGAGRPLDADEPDARDLATRPSARMERPDDDLGDVALLVAWNDMETDPPAPHWARLEAEPVEYEATGDDHREWSGWETTRTVPDVVEPVPAAPAIVESPESPFAAEVAETTFGPGHAHQPPVTVPTTRDTDANAALVAQMLEAELAIEDRATTPRARLIRDGGRAVVDAGSSELIEFTGTVLEPAVTIAEPVVVSIPRLPAPEPPAPQPPLRNRVLVPTPVAPVTSWSAPTLRAFGVPDGIVERISAQRPVDELEWTVAFMLAVRDLCRRLPSGPSVLVGPSGANLARQLGLISFSGDELGLSCASVASPNAGPVTLRRAAGGRHVHLVVGGNWHHLVTVRPTIVSAATDHDLLEALRVAEAWGAALGWTLEGDRYVRIDSFLLAGRVRGLLPTPAELCSNLDPARLAPFD